MARQLEFAAAAKTDFEIIFDHLFDSYVEFGETPAEAFEHAETRLLQIRSDSERILNAPHRGQRHDDLLEGSRNLVIGRASYWFTADTSSEVVSILAVFFGGQEERQRMILRLLEGGLGGLK